MGLSILHFKESQLGNDAFLSMKIVLNFAPVQTLMKCCILGIHYLPKYLSMGFQYKPLKHQSRLQQTTNFVRSFLIFEKIRYDIS